MADIKTTLCWNCQKAVCGCSWSRNYVPVKGWDATPTIVQNHADGRQIFTNSYLVRSCPEFVKDKVRKCKKYKGE